MELSDKESDLLEALKGTAKSAASIVPVISQAIAGYDSYHRSVFERNLKNALKHLQEKVDDIPSFFETDWYKSKDGKQFANKVFDAALDAQLEDKQELFINTLINGPSAEHLNQLEKLKFIDILRHMSRASLMVLADIHNLMVKNVRRENQQKDLIDPFPVIKVENLVNELSDKYHPYLINSAVKEMEGQGLFSNIGSWKKRVTVSISAQVVSLQSFATLNMQQILSILCKSKPIQTHIGIGTAITDRPSHTTRHTDRVPRRFGRSGQENREDIA